jgi:hypothetical protein
MQSNFENLIQKGARPIQSQLLGQHYAQHNFQRIDMEHYLESWKKWLAHSKSKTLVGLEEFKHGDYTQGTTQTFDQFILRHTNSKQIVVFQGEFQYHACVSKRTKFEIIGDPNQLQNDQALILSVPFSDLGICHPRFEDTLDICNQLDIPVCLDLAYWGIAKNINIDLTKYYCVKEITCSLSKPFFTLENHRVGVRFCRDYVDDGISMINEVGMQNFYSMSLGMHYMNSFSNDWNWMQFGNLYNQVCENYNLSKTDTIIFATSKLDQFKKFERGIVGNYRICISKLLSDIQ